MENYSSADRDKQNQPRCVILSEAKNPFSLLGIYGSFDFVTQILGNLLHSAQDDEKGGGTALDVPEGEKILSPSLLLRKIQPPRQRGPWQRTY